MHVLGLSFVLEIICTDLVSWHYNKSSTGYFEIKKTGELVAGKYYEPIFYYNIKAYIKGCDIYLASKIIRRKLYEDLQLLLKNLQIDFVLELAIFTNWKGNFKKG